MTTSSSAETDAIIVPGSRIRNVPVASPVITLDQESIRDSGQSTVADAVRTIPQNFGGGQNPGIGFNVPRSEEHTSELQSLMRNSYAVFCLNNTRHHNTP